MTKPTNREALLKGVIAANRDLLRAQDDLDAAVRDAYRNLSVSWAEIGNCLGITRQAAWDRFHLGTDVPLRP